MTSGSSDDWTIETVDGVGLARSRMLARIAGVAHAFSTRLADGASDFDLGGAPDADPRYAARRARFLQSAGLAGRAPFPLSQVHGASVRRVSEPTSPVPEADAALALREEARRHVPAVRTADCAAILLADTAGRAVAAVHAGWRGTAQRIAIAAVERLAGVGIEPASIRAAIGPAAGVCCYEVGEEVIEAVSRASGAAEETVCRGNGGPRRLDLAGANRLQLLSAGLPAEGISVAPWCTICNPALFFSYRRQGIRSGRQMAGIGWDGAP